VNSRSKIFEGWEKLFSEKGRQHTHLKCGGKAFIAKRRCWKMGGQALEHQEAE